MINTCTSGLLVLDMHVSYMGVIERGTFHYMGVLVGLSVVYNKLVLCRDITELMDYKFKIDSEKDSQDSQFVAFRGKEVIPVFMAENIKPEQAGRVRELCKKKGIVQFARNGKAIGRVSSSTIGWRI